MLKTITRNHGENMECPTCGATGRFDDMTGGNDRNEAQFKDAVWFNRHEQNWECFECWLK